ncbi:GNAT family N-acetyltransferase [Tenuibacillus multivorans]|uniref:Acetyltransferase (GNAT) family protein n=1 Tax=Tenuibacillus multivorans TaxID=237069 RepID=A0A1H0DD18_9BACI|nr:GNAT family N-acetyltransferase [Tenuibacillus multivorans]GEL76599.1 hypothetical protein TMU01_08340 [Tenuibacillus multivorans]SDN68177.1 Acetyltransferase (GNAT) family protein [Tenuibacillus multivorans]
MIDTIQIRQLRLEDHDLVKSMQTGIEDDYIVRVFERLIRNDVIYGLFNDDQLVSTAGYSLYANQYAMLGRLRSDNRYKGKGYATQLIEFIIEQLQHENHIKWIGANTQRHNFPALRVLNKLNLPQLKALHGSTLVKPEVLNYTPGEKWTPIETLEGKREVLSSIEHNPDVIFPYECYYPFPSHPNLFKDDEIKDWYFFKNPNNNRFIIINFDQKKHQYAHVVYLWDDVFTQPGLWETILDTHKEFQKTYGDDTYVWIDLTDESRKDACEEAFQIQDPWILHGKWK